jgi:hypothetical protein
MFGGLFLLMSTLHLMRYFVQPRDIWWTPKPLALPLADTADRVEVYVRDVALAEHIRGGRLQLVGGTGGTPVQESDIRVRFNNWDRIRAERVPSLLSAGIALGASGVLLLFGLLGWSPSNPMEGRSRLPERGDG